MVTSLCLQNNCRHGLVAPGPEGYDSGSLFDGVSPGSPKDHACQGCHQLSESKGCYTKWVRGDRKELKTMLQVSVVCQVNRPKALVTELKEYATSWLKPQTPGEQMIVDKVVLEQVYQAVPAPVWGWLMYNNPVSLSQATTYLENYFLAENATRPKALLPERTESKKGPRGNAEEPLKVARPGWILAVLPPR